MVLNFGQIENSTLAKVDLVFRLFRGGAVAEPHHMKRAVSPVGHSNGFAKKRYSVIALIARKRSISSSHVRLNHKLASTTRCSARIAEPRFRRLDIGEYNICWYDKISKLK
jgi:hypothetical protein